MRIAFDLDGTLIACGYAFPTMKKWPASWLFFINIEYIRAGTDELVKYLQQQGEEVWIYTTSFRSSIYIRFLFLLYGIKLNGIINQSIHTRKLENSTDLPVCSKYPPLFGIGLLVDDQPGVEIEAMRYGFQMICIKPKATNRVEQVKGKYLQLKQSSQLQQF